MIAAVAERLVDQVLPVGGQVVHREGRRRQQQHRHAGQHDDRHGLALD